MTMVALGVVGLIGVPLAIGLVVLVAKEPPYAGAQRDMARTDARVIQAAAHQRRLDHPSEACPSVEQLREDHAALAGATKNLDPWDTPFKIVCDDRGVTVVSFGPDQKEGTSDDIAVGASK